MASAAATAATARATKSTARTSSVRASASAPTGSTACLPDLRTGRPARASARQASSTESPVVKTPRRGVGRRPTPRRGAPIASREESPGGGAAGPTAGPSRRLLAIPSRPLAGHAVGPTAVAADCTGGSRRRRPSNGADVLEGLGEGPAAETATGVEGCTSGTCDREKVDAAESAAGRGGEQPAGAERFDHSGWVRMAGPLSDRERRKRAPEGGWAVASRRCCHRRADAHAQGREGRRENRGRPNRRGVALAAVVGRSRRGLHVGGRDREGSTVCAG